jgi:hypothetical protein
MTSARQSSTCSRRRWTGKWTGPQF